MQESKTSPASQSPPSCPLRQNACAWLSGCRPCLLIAVVAVAATLLAAGAGLLSGWVGAARDVGSANTDADRAATSSPAVESAATTAPAAAAEPPPDAETVWQTDFETALALASERNQPVLLRFTAEWCVPCQVMEKSVFPQQDVKAAIAEHAIPVKIDIDEARNADVARRFGVRAIPTLVLVDAGGQELNRGSFMSAEALAAFLERS